MVLLLRRSFTIREDAFAKTRSCAAAALRRIDPARGSAESIGMTDPAATDSLEATLLALVAARGPDKTICPSEVARAVAGSHPDQWGPLMQPVRRIAVRLANEGRLVISRKGRPVDPNDFRGVYRLSQPRQD
jgi:hypothetical protein